MKNIKFAGGFIEIKIDNVQFPTKTPSEILDSGQYFKIHPRILKRQDKLAYRDGIFYMGIWSPCREISIEQAYKTIHSMSMRLDGKVWAGRPGGILELASYEAVFHQQLGKSKVVALGERIFHNNESCVASRYLHGTRKKLYLSNTKHLRTPQHSFLVVFE